jgi:hypothetical protein
VDQPSTTNVSGHWFKYPGCQKLEYYTRSDRVDTNNYYLGCYYFCGPEGTRPPPKTPRPSPLPSLRACLW